MSVELLTEHNLEFLSLKGGCTGSSESTHVKMPQCWKSQIQHLRVLRQEKYFSAFKFLRAVSVEFSMNKFYNPEIDLHCELFM